MAQTRRGRQAAAAADGEAEKRGKRVRISETQEGQQGAQGARTGAGMNLRSMGSPTGFADLEALKEERRKAARLKKEDLLKFNGEMNALRARLGALGETDPQHRDDIRRIFFDAAAEEICRTADEAVKKFDNKYRPLRDVMRSCTEHPRAHGGKGLVDQGRDALPPSVLHFFQKLFTTKSNPGRAAAGGGGHPETEEAKTSRGILVAAGAFLSARAAAVGGSKRYTNDFCQCVAMRLHMLTGSEIAVRILHNLGFGVPSARWLKKQLGAIGEDGGASTDGRLELPDISYKGPILFGSDNYQSMKHHSSRTSSESKPEFSVYTHVVYFPLGARETSRSENTPASAETGTNTAAAPGWQELQQTKCLEPNQWLKADLDAWAKDLDDAVKATTELTDRTEDGLGEKTAFMRADNDCWARAFDLLFDIVRREGREGMESLFKEMGKPWQPGDKNSGSPATATPAEEQPESGTESDGRKKRDPLTGRPAGRNVGEDPDDEPPATRVLPMLNIVGTLVVSPLKRNTSSALSLLASAPEWASRRRGKHSPTRIAPVTRVGNLPFGPPPLVGRTLFW